MQWDVDREKLDKGDNVTYNVIEIYHIDFWFDSSARLRVELVVKKCNSFASHPRANRKKKWEAFRPFMKRQLLLNKPSITKKTSTKELPMVSINVKQRGRATTSGRIFYADLGPH